MNGSETARERLIVASNNANKLKEFEGILKDFTEETITLEVDETELIINRKEIAMIRLAIDF